MEGWQNLVLRLPAKEWLSRKRHKGSNPLPSAFIMLIAILDLNLKTIARFDSPVSSAASLSNQVSQLLLNGADAVEFSVIDDEPITIASDILKEALILDVSSIKRPLSTDYV